MAGAWKCCTKERDARARWEQVKRRLRRLDAWRTLRKMRAAQTNPANIAMAGLDEGFAIACAGTYQAHFEAFAACACDGKLWNARRRAAALGSARFRAVGLQQSATKTHCSHTAVAPQQSGTLSAPLAEVKPSAPPGTKTFKDVRQGIRHCHHSFTCKTTASTWAHAWHLPGSV